MPTVKNERRERFAAIVAATSNTPKDIGCAYTAAGYESKSNHVAETCGIRLSRMAAVAARIAELRCNASKAVDLTVKAIADVVLAKQLDKQWLLEKAKKILERCLQEEAVYDSEGNPVGEYVFAHSGANKALELIARVQGHLAPVQTKQIPATFREWLSQLSAEEYEVAKADLEKQRLEMFGGDQAKLEAYRAKILSEGPIQ
jgi:hypothetical protein